MRLLIIGSANADIVRVLLTWPGQDEPVPYDIDPRRDLTPNFAFRDEQIVKNYTHPERTHPTTRENFSRIRRTGR